VRDLRAFDDVRLVSAPAGSSAADVTRATGGAPNRSSNTSGQPLVLGASSASGREIPPPMHERHGRACVRGLERDLDLGVRSILIVRPPVEHQTLAGSHAVTMPQSPSEPSDRIS
jgi:hypothetical protein